MDEAIKYVEKWKPRMLHMEPRTSEQMQAAMILGKIQTKHGKDYAITSAIASSSWRLPVVKEALKSKSIYQTVVYSCWNNGTNLRVCTSDQVLRDRLKDHLRRRPVGFPRDVVRRVVGEVADMGKNRGTIGCGYI